MSNDLILVSVADQHPIVISGVRAVLRTEKDLQLVAATLRSSELLPLHQTDQIDVAVIAIEMLKENDELISELRAHTAALKFVFMWQTAPTHEELESLGCLRHGNFAKTDNVKLLPQIIRAQYYGDAQIRTSVHRTTEEERKAAMLLDTLSPTQRRIFGEIAKGKTAPEIAKTLSMSTKAVDTHKMHIRNKLGVKSRVEITRIALSTRVLKPEE